MSKHKKNKEKKSRSTRDAARRRAETHKGDFTPTAFKLPENVQQFSLSDEKTRRIDIIPYEVGEGNPYADAGALHYERTYWRHRDIGTDGNNYVCNKKTSGGKCPICDFRAKLAKDPDADEDLIKSLAPKERQLFNVIDTKDRKKGVQVWEISFHLFGKRLDAEINNQDDDDDYEGFSELEGGKTLKIAAEEKSLGRSNFYEVTSINFKDRTEDYDEDILEKTTCLDDILIVMEYDELKAILLETASDEDNDADEKPKSKKKKDEGKKKKDDDDDDDNKSKFKKGDSVTFEDEDGDDSSGVIKKIKGDTAIIENEDGDKVTIDLDDLTLFEDETANDGAADAAESEEDDDIPFEKGDEVLSEIDGEEYAGVIKKIKGDTATVLFEDGDELEIDLDDLTRPDPDASEDEPEEKPKDKKNKKGKCPHGHKFGKDTDSFEEDCEDCDVWDECDDA